MHFGEDYESNSGVHQMADWAAHRKHPAGRNLLQRFSGIVP